MAMVAIGVMMLGVMTGVIGPGVSPCAMVRPCRSWRDKYDDGSRTQCQRDETKRPAKRKQLTHTYSSVDPHFPFAFVYERTRAAFCVAM
jgi:hypothetical protein